MVAACATDATTAAPDKDQFRDGTGKSDNGDDVCAVYGWYGDGECDAFCAQRDPDCATDARQPELAHARDALASKISMADAAKQVEAATGTVIECKFEPDDQGNLSLSLYPLGKAVTVDAKNNLFQEASGDPTTATFAPGLDVFHDFEHLAVSTRDLTLVQLSQRTVRDAIYQGTELGFVYWTIPTMQSGRAGYGVYGVSPDGESAYAFIDGHGSRTRQTVDLGAGPTSPTDDRVVELGDDVAIVRQSKITMLDAIDQAEASKGKIVEAKFELGDDHKLSLSLYPVKDFTLDASRNELGELSGDPTVANWAPDYAKFDVPDEEHVTTAARDLTLVQAAGMNLRSAVARVAARFPGGFVYWAIPTRQGTRAAYGVYVLDAQNRSHYVLVS
ncbi:MAG TPA: hypothetical protein VF403_18735 [Kofleriaceae bacterium]